MYWPSNLKIARKYLGEPVKIIGNSYVYYSPFREENTPSYFVHNKYGFTDFGTKGLNPKLRNLNSIELVAKLYDIPGEEAHRKIMRDFKDLIIRKDKKFWSKLKEEEINEYFK